MGFHVSFRERNGHLLRVSISILIFASGKMTFQTLKSRGLGFRVYGLGAAIVSEVNPKCNGLGFRVWGLCTCENLEPTYTCIYICTYIYHYNPVKIELRDRES